VVPELLWMLLYTKPYAESWAEINLRKQGFATLLPRVHRRGGVAPLFPRYLFVGHRRDRRSDPLRSTRGVLYVVQCGERPARVPYSVVEEVRSRMDEQGIVALDEIRPADPLFAKAERERVRALVKFARAGFRVVA